MNILLEITVNNKLYYLLCLNCHRNLIIRNESNDRFKFQVYRIYVAYLQTYYNPLRGLYSLQIGHISSISDELENF
jgi:hypothetical protein